MTDINRATIDVEVRIRFEENGHRRDDLLQPMICHMKRTWILYCFKYLLVRLCYTGIIILHALYIYI